MLSLIARGRVAPMVAADSLRLREQDLRGRIDALTDVVVDRAGTGTLRGAKLSAASIDTARERLDSAQRAYSSLLLQDGGGEPAYAQLVSGETVGWQDSGWPRA